MQEEAETAIQEKAFDLGKKAEKVNFTCDCFFFGLVDSNFDLRYVFEVWIDGLDIFFR